MNKEQIWSQFQQNSQQVAEAAELVEEGQQFTLTTDQEAAIEVINECLEEEPNTRFLLKAPTGAGKTEVFTRVAIHHIIEGKPFVLVLLPTRDLVRQQYQYFLDRTEGTGIKAVEVHGGIPPKQRFKWLEEATEGKVHIVYGSAVFLQHRKYTPYLSKAGLVIIDDVNAFDEDDLPILHKVDSPIIYTTATPEAVEPFLKKNGAWNNRFEMTQKPFDAPDTVVHELQGTWNENIFSQLEKGFDLIKSHLDRESRIYVISRTRAKVPIIAEFLEDYFQVHVSVLHGDMLDTAKEARRKKSAPKEDRITMMKQFRANKPAILVATNLVGSGMDIPAADLMFITDADHFGEAEQEQLIGRVGRRKRESDAVLIKGTVGSSPFGRSKVKATSYVRNGKLIQSYRPAPPKRGSRVNSRRLV